MRCDVLRRIALALNIVLLQEVEATTQDHWLVGDELLAFIVVQQESLAPRVH